MGYKGRPITYFNFRIWDLEEKKMRDVLRIDFTFQRVSFMVLDNGEKRIYSLPLGSVVLMVSPMGLIDKNGTRIFTKDVVVDEVGRKYVVEYYQYCLYPFGVFSKDGEQLVSENESEVIGNIFENPELVKGTKYERYLNLLEKWDYSRFINELTKEVYHGFD